MTLTSRQKIVVTFLLLFIGTLSFFMFLGENSYFPIFSGLSGQGPVPGLAQPVFGFDDAVKLLAKIYQGRPVSPELSALYNQSTVGDVTVERPYAYIVNSWSWIPWTNERAGYQWALAEWDAWNALRGMNMEEAQRIFIAKVEALEKIL